MGKLLKLRGSCGGKINFMFRWIFPGIFSCNLACALVARSGDRRCELKYVSSILDQRIDTLARYRILETTIGVMAPLAAGHSSKGVSRSAMINN